MKRSKIQSLIVLISVACLSIGCAGGSGDPRSADNDPAVAAPAAPGASGTVLLYTADRYEGVFELDPDTLEIIDRIDTGPRPHGLVASPDGTLLYVTVETSNELLKIDVSSNEIIARVEVSPVPNEPTITRDGRYIYVPSRSTDQCDVVDTETMEVVKRLPAGRFQHNAYTSADGSRVYVTSMGDDLISVIDPASQEILRKVPMGGEPRPVALTEDGSVAYVALSGLLGFVVWDLSSDEVSEGIALPIPEGTPPPLLDTYTHGLLVTPNQRELWVAGYGVGKVYAYLLPGLEPLAEIETDGGPHWFTLHPSGEPLYVTLENTGSVSAIHRGLRTVMRTARVGEGPTRILAFSSPVSR